MKNLDDIADILEASMGPESRTPEIAAFVLQGTRLLSSGKAIAASDVATEIGMSSHQLQDVLIDLKATRQIEFSDDDRLVAIAGLTLHPTANALSIGNVQLYTWCAIDALFFPALLNRTAHIRSLCPMSGQSIELKVEPDASSVEADPDSTCVSIVIPESRSTVESHNCTDDELFGASGSFCSRVSFYQSAKEAEQATAGMSDTIILPVAEARKLAVKAWADSLLRQAGRFQKTITLTD